MQQMYSSRFFALCTLLLLAGHCPSSCEASVMSFIRAPFTWLGYGSASQEDDQAEMTDMNDMGDMSDLQADMSELQAREVRAPEMDLSETTTEKEITTTTLATTTKLPTTAKLLTTTTLPTTIKLLTTSKLLSTTKFPSTAKIVTTTKLPSTTEQLTTTTLPKITTLPTTTTTTPPSTTTSTFAPPPENVPTFLYNADFAAELNRLYYTAPIFAPNAHLVQTKKKGNFPGLGLVA